MSAREFFREIMREKMALRKKEKRLPGTFYFTGPLRERKTRKKEIPFFSFFCKVPSILFSFKWFWEIITSISVYGLRQVLIM